VKLATLKNGTPDGALAVVTPDGTRALKIGSALPNLLSLMEDWSAGQKALLEAQERLVAGESEAVAARDFAAPLPRHAS
jgi:fumarylacetoacetate (FAA) hydrolase